MTDRIFARKRVDLSWHVIAFHTRGLNTWKALCGRTALDPTVDELPGDEKTCERCAVIAVRQDDGLSEAFVQAASEEAG